MRNDRPIADSLEAYGEWAQIEIEFLTQFIPDGGVILDCGSHVGVHTTAFARASKRARVHAFEAQPQLAALLAQNAAALGDRVVVHEWAVGAAIGAGFIERLPDDQNVNAGAQAIRTEIGADSFVVPINTIDSLDLNGIAFVKLDIEGFEASALRGAARSIARDKPTIFCEVNSIGAAAELFRTLEGQSYQTYFIATPAFNPENFRLASTNFFGVAQECGLLFLPAERPAPNVGRVAACAQVRDVDEFAPMFFKMPRYGDETDRDRDCTWLNQELARDRQQLAVAKGHGQVLERELALSRRQSADFSEQVEYLKQELAVSRQRIADAATAIETLRHETRIEKQRRKVLGEFIRKGEFSARRRSAMGAIARLCGRSRLAKACRVLTRSGLFDRKFYKRAYPDVSASTLEPVAHYLLYGGFEGHKPNPVFDSAYYLSENADVRDAGINPLLHYIQSGAVEMRRPNADFDVEACLEALPQPINCRALLLKHFLAAETGEYPLVKRYRPVAPEWAAFEALVIERKNAPSGSPVVDVIVPVYRGYDDTMACIHSVLASHNATPFELVVIDDASPEAALSKALGRLAELGLISLLRNQRNLGFVGAVNRGMALHEMRDVLLLNSDTLVFNNWLDRIRAHGSEPGVASVTPFTNNGTICSYPKFCRDNSGEPEVTYPHLDQLAAWVNRGESITVPTGVGFCMYLPRKALRAIGYFDVETFGKGYGEENDFCMRASELGMRNVHALDVFVFHSGETSFGPGASKAKQHGISRLTAKHPSYHAIVQNYIAADPARMARERLDLARLVKIPSERTLLCFTHSWGGGIERYLRDRAAAGLAKGETLLLAVPAANGRRIKLVSVDEMPALRNLPDFDLDEGREALAELLRPFRVSGVEVHSTVGWSARALVAIPSIARSLGVPFDFMAHDYLSICPRIHLINESGIYCGEEGEAQCRRCMNGLAGWLSKVHPDFASAGMGDIAVWRSRYECFLKAAREVAAPSSDTAKRLHAYFPTIDFVLRPHEEAIDAYARSVAASYAGGALRVVVIGTIGSHKGSEVLRQCAEDAARRRLPLHFTVVGSTSIPNLDSLANVEVTGAYAEREVFDRLAEANAHVALLPSVWPETYSYTLTIAMKGGFRICAFDIGAPAERLRASGDYILLPASMMTDATAINDTLLASFTGRKAKTTA
jgi:FkbM family methyltransferase